MQHEVPQLYTCYCCSVVASRVASFTGLSSPQLEVEAEIVAVLPEFNQVRVLAKDGTLYAVSRHTKGVNVAELQKGQRLLCIVTQHPARVLHAHLIEAAKGA